MIGLAAIFGPPARRLAPVLAVLLALAAPVAAGVDLPGATVCSADPTEPDGEDETACEVASSWLVARSAALPRTGREHGRSELLPATRPVTPARHSSAFPPPSGPAVGSRLRC